MMIMYEKYFSRINTFTTDGETTYGTVLIIMTGTEASAGNSVVPDQTAP